MTLTIPTALSGHLETSRTHFFARCYKIVRNQTPKIEYYLTDHPRPLTLTFTGVAEEYSPAYGAEGSARSRQANLESSNASVKGFLETTEISDAVLRARQMDRAAITEYLVDWRKPWLGAFETSEYWIRRVRWDKNVWRAEVTGIADWLAEPVGGKYGTTCTVDLFSQGNFKCNVDPDPSAGFVLTDRSVTAVDATYPRKIFRTSTVLSSIWGGPSGNGYGWSEDGVADDGKILWKVGNNRGIVSDIKNSTHITGLTMEFELHESLPFDIEVGDDGDLFPGCNKQAGVVSNDGHCIRKYGNGLNFQGEPFVVDLDKMIKGLF